MSLGLGCLAVVCFYCVVSEFVCFCLFGNLVVLLVFICYLMVWFGVWCFSAIEFGGGVLVIRFGSFLVGLIWFEFAVLVLILLDCW